jgi:hypothetical protein
VVRGHHFLPGTSLLLALSLVCKARISVIHGYQNSTNALAIQFLRAAPSLLTVAT